MFKKTNLLCFLTPAEAPAFALRLPVLPLRHNEEQSPGLWFGLIFLTAQTSNANQNEDKLKKGERANTSKP